MIAILNLRNLHCGACAKRVANAIVKAQGDAKAEAQVETGRVSVKSAGPPAVDAWLKALNETRHPASIAA